MGFSFAVFLKQHQYSRRKKLHHRSCLWWWCLVAPVESGGRIKSGGVGGVAYENNTNESGRSLRNTYIHEKQVGLLLMLLFGTLICLALLAMFVDVCLICYERRGV